MPDQRHRFTIEAHEPLPDRFMVEYRHPKLGTMKRWFWAKDEAIEWMDLVSLIPGVSGVKLSEHWQMPNYRVLERRDE